MTFDEWKSNPQETAFYMGHVVLFVEGRGVVGACETLEELRASPVYGLHAERAYVCRVVDIGIFDVISQPTRRGPRTPDEWLRLLMACQDGTTTCMTVYWAIDQELGDERERSSTAMREKDQAELTDLRNSRNHLLGVVHEVSRIIQRDQNRGLTIAQCVQEVVDRLACAAASIEGTTELMDKATEEIERLKPYKEDIQELIGALSEAMARGNTENTERVFDRMANKYL